MREYRGASTETCPLNSTLLVCRAEARFCPRQPFVW